MLVVNSNIQAQAFIGSSSVEHAGTKEAGRGHGWSLFVFDGIKPETELEMQAYVNTQSLADMYNKCIAIGKTTLKQVFGNSLLDSHQRVVYQGKGVTYCEFVGLGTLSLLTPNRIQENAGTKRSLSLFTTRPTHQGLLPEHLSTEDTIVEFDKDVVLSHLVRYGSTLDMCEVVALKLIDDVETEVPMGTLTLEPGNTHLYKFQAPTTARKFKVKAPTKAVAPFDFLSFSTEPVVDEVLPAPTWCMLVHTNNFTHGDIFHSPEHMYIVDHCRKEGPYVTSTNLKADKVNYVYCPKIRIDNWSI